MAGGDIIWSAGLDGSGVTGGVQVFLEDDVFVGTQQQNVFRIDSEGNVVWSADSGSSTGDALAGGVVNQNGDYIIGGNDDVVRALNFEDGSLLWSYSTTASADDSAPALDGRDAVIGTNDGIYSFDNLDGSVNNHNTSFRSDSSPAILSDDRVVWPSNDQIAITDTQGNTLEIWSVPGQGALCHAGVDEDDYVYTYLDSPETELAKVSPSGNVVWTRSVAYGRQGHVAVDDEADRVYCTNFYFDNQSSSNDKFALDVFDRSGNSIYSIADTSVSYSLASAIHITAVPMRDDGVIVPWEGGLRKLNRNGNEDWSVTLESGGTVYSSPAASEDGFVAAGATDGRIYKVETDSTPRYTLPDANQRPWSYARFRHNSGAFEDNTVLMLEDSLGLRGAIPKQDDQTVIHTDGLARGEKAEQVGDEVVLVLPEVGQG